MATLNVESKKKRKSHPSKKKQNSTVSSPQVLDRNKDDNEDNNPIESLLTKRYVCILSDYKTLISFIWEIDSIQ